MDVCGGAELGDVVLVVTVIPLSGVTVVGGAITVGGAGTVVSGTSSPGVTARAAADGEPSRVGVSVTWDRTLPTAAAATAIASTVAPTQTIPNPIPRFIYPV